MTSFDAIVVGGGPNGLAAGIALAREGIPTLLLEANDAVGGGARTSELTLPHFLHDSCSAIHPMALLSPFFRTLPLAERGLEWRFSPHALAHPLDSGGAAVLTGSVAETAARLGGDGGAYGDLMEPFERHASALFDAILRPLSPLTKQPLLLSRFGMTALRSASSVMQRFESEEARALFGGCAAHSFLPLDRHGSASFGVVLALAAHAAGWPVARRGSAAITGALAALFRSYGGVIETGRRVRSLRELPASRAVLFDVTPRQLARIAADDLPPRYLRRLGRYAYGPGVFKIDWALDGPIPWKAAECGRAATVHVGGTFAEIAHHEREIWSGRNTDRPFVLVAQQSLFDETRAPAGKQTGWAYCHVPHGSREDMTEAIERQVERFAPGFRDRILARSTMDSAQFEAHDENFVGGDIAGGAHTLMQLLMRPFPAFDPYATPNPRLFLASSSTPPGAGVHGMCGFWAAQSALRRLFR
jgi:phytoene dehydrogenase-like protein